jgi:2-haloacid dehalogenase
MSVRDTVALDIIGTCFSLDRPRARLAELGAPEHTLELWFAQTLRDGMALSHAGGYRPLKEVLRAELPRTLGMVGVDAPIPQLEAVVASFSELDPQPGLLEMIEALSGSGWRLLALTNGSEQSTRELLRRAGVVDRFAALLSCDAIGKFKPHPDVYQRARREAEGELWMVAAHAWDIAGAAMAGLRTLYVSGLEGRYLDVYPPPDAAVGQLAEVADRLRAVQE